MNVHGVGPQQQGWQVFKNRQETQGKTESAAAKPQVTPAPPAASTPAEVVATASQEKGVVRLLQEGHFHGVAEVRLQINFHEELQQAAAQEAGAAWASNTQEFMASLSTEVKTTMAGYATAENIDPIMQTFAEAAGPFLSGSTDGRPFDLNAAITGLTDAFNDLISDLDTFNPAATTVAPVVADTEVAGTPDEAPSVPESEPVVAADASLTETATSEPETNTEPATPSFADAIANLQQWFDQEMTTLQTTIDGLLQPSEPSEPRGKGVAYEWFLATYQSLFAVTGSGAEEGSSSAVEGVQTEA